MEFKAGVTQVKQMIRLPGKAKQVFDYWALIVEKYGHKTLGELGQIKEKEVINNEVSKM